MSNVLFPRKISEPPERRSRDASGIELYGSAHIAAPYSLMTKSTELSARGTCSPAALMRGNSKPNST